MRAGNKGLKKTWITMLGNELHPHNLCFFKANLIKLTRM